MIRRLFLGTALTLACASAVVTSVPSFGQEKAGGAGATAADNLKLYLMDGSVLAGKIGAQAIDVQTKYGTLKIPLSDVRSFTPGLASHTEFNEKLQQYITDLGADGFAEREKATEALRKMGPEIRPELEKALKTAETEKQARLTKLIEEIDQNKQGAGDDDAGGDTWMRNDTIVTPEFTVSGQILTKTFDVTSNYGALTVKLGDIKAVKREGQRNYENSNIRLSKGDVVQITATGSIVMQPWGSNSVSGPDGGNNYGMMQPGNFPGGALIARINQNGPLFKVGSKYSFTADRPGVLMFGIAMQNDYSGSGYQFPGEYTVKIRVIKKAAQ
jgi:hypothetical protein